MLQMMKQIKWKKQLPVEFCSRVLRTFKLTFSYLKIKTTWFGNNILTFYSWIHTCCPLFIISALQTVLKITTLHEFYHNMKTIHLKMRFLKTWMEIVNRSTLHLTATFKNYITLHSRWLTRFKIFCLPNYRSIVINIKQLWINNT